MEMSRKLHAPAALPQWKSSRYPLDRRLGGPQNRSGRGGEKKFQPVQGIIQHVTQLYTTELSGIPLEESK
jgi:hypothetical protein